MSRALVQSRPAGTARRWAVRTVAAAAVGSGWAAPALATSPSVAEALETAVIRELESARSTVAPDPFAEVSGNAPRPLPTTDAVELRPAGPAIRPRQASPSHPLRQAVVDDRTAAAETPRELDATGRHDGRDLPSMHARSGQGAVAPASGLRPAAMSVPPAPSAEPDRLPDEADREPDEKPGSMTKMKGFFTSMFNRGGGRPTATAAARGGRSSRSKGGLFAGFGRSKERDLPTQPPIPPELPRFIPPEHVASTPAATPPAAVPAAVVPPPPAPPAPVAEASSGAGDAVASARPFDDWAGDRPAPPAAPPADVFAEVRSDDGPGTSTAADDDFRDPAVASDGTPRRLDADQPAKQIDRGGESRVELDRKLAERSGLGGFQGFCPVALRDQRTLVDARPEFLTVYEGRTYEFSSAQAKARFEASPERYAPAQGGRDVVLAGRGDPEVEGSLTYAAWFKDRLYLFRTAESLKEFNAQPSKFAPAG